jgi:peptidoglycan/xylan/chitin deacetylase (PgdA/CDA1 family)
VTQAVVHNLTFHGVGEPPRALAPGEAECWLSADGLAAALDAVECRDDVRITFDDSNRSDVDLALHALLERDLAATFFVLAGRLDDPEHLGREDLERLVDAGMSVGSHGLNHRDWRRLDDAELAREVGESRGILERVLGQPVAEVSLPFGSYDRRVLACVRREGGYEHAYTSDGGPARRDAWLQSRTTVTPADGADGLARRPGHADRARLALKRRVKQWR